MINNNNNVYTFLGAIVIGVVGAAGMYIAEKYFEEKRNKHRLDTELARLDEELITVKRELRSLALLNKKSNKTARVRSKTNTSTTTNEDYLSATNLDSSDLEFYDVSDDEVDNTNLEATLQEIDHKLNEGNLGEQEAVLEKLTDLCIGHPENAELLWRIGKAHHKIGEKYTDKEVLLEHVVKGLKACEQAIAIQPNCADSHKWFAILIGSRADFQSTKDKISDGSLFKEHVDIAIKLRPEDASLHHMLGRFAFEISGLKWYERKVAAAFFGDLPQATYEEALEHFLEAERLAGFDWKDNRLMIAKCKVALEEYKEAVEWLEKAAATSEQNSIDDKVDLEVKALLQQYNTYK